MSNTAEENISVCKRLQAIFDKPNSHINEVHSAAVSLGCEPVQRLAS